MSVPGRAWALSGAGRVFAVGTLLSLRCSRSLSTCNPCSREGSALHRLGPRCMAQDSHGSLSGLESLGPHLPLGECDQGWVRTAMHTGCGPCPAGQRVMSGMYPSPATEKACRVAP